MGLEIPAEWIMPELGEWEAMVFAAFRLLSEQRPWAGTMRGLIPLGIPYPWLRMAVVDFGLADGASERVESMELLQAMDREWLAAAYARIAPEKKTDKEGV